MKKKIKLLISIAGFCLSLAVFAFGVIAGINVAYVAQGVINYQIEEANVSIETRVYSTSKKFNSQEDFEQTAKIIEHSEFAKLNSQTTLDEEFDFKSVQLKNISTPSAFSETNPDYVDKYTNRDNPTPPNDLVLDLDYEYKSSSRTMAYFVVIKVTNESPFPIYTQVKTKGAEGDENIYKAPENSYTYKTAKIEILQPAKQNEAYPYTYICFAMGIEDAGWEMDEVEFNYPIIVNQDDPQTGAFSRPYVAQVENVFSQTTEGETQISSTGSTLTNVPVATYMGAIGYSILNLVLPTTTQATSDVVITLSMSLSMGGQTENLTPLIEMVALIPIKCSTIDECLANEGNALQIMPELSSDQTYYTITIPTSVLSSTRTDLTVLPMIDVDMAVNIESAQIGVDYTLSSTQEGVTFNSIKTITEWGMVDYKKMGEEFIDPINVDVTTVSLGTDSMSFSASLRNFQLRKIPTDAQAIRVSFTTSDKVQAAFVMNGQKDVLTIVDMMMVLEGEVESIAGVKNNTTTIDFPVTSTQDGTMDFYICLYYYQTMVSDGEEIPLTLKVEYVEFTEEESPLLFELDTDDNFNLYWRITGVKDSTATDISIPAYYKNLPIKEMYSDTFQNNAVVENITFEEGCVFNSIYPYQFSGCTNLQRISFGPNVQITSIGEYAFQNCTSLKSFEIPTSITTIQSNAFAGSGVETITFEDGTVLTSLPDNLFKNCTSLKTITIPSVITSIGSYVFSGCTSLTNIIFEEPSRLTTIKSYAFQNCTSLVTIELPNSVTILGSYIFSGCSKLSNVLFEESCVLTTIESYAFQNCISLTSFDLPDSVKTIGSNVFSGCNRFSNIIIRETSTLRTINSYAFQNCTGLTSFYIPHSLTTIGNYAFSGCTGLTSITIPNSVTSIGQYAFQNCSGLVEINYNTNNISSFSSNSYIFRYSGSTSNGCEVNFGSNVTKVPDYIFSQSYITKANITVYVTSIGNYAFNNSRITEITIPNTITTIGNYAFANCGFVTKVDFNNTVITAFTNNSYIFYNTGSSSGFQANFGANVTKVPDYMFYQSYITQPNITSNIRQIGQYAFSNCMRLTTINVPNSITGIGNYAFANCGNVTQITYDSKINYLSNSYVFRYTGSTTSGCTVNIGSTTTIIASSLFYDSYISQVNIPTNITTIESSAFYNCSKLTQITIPSSVNDISSSAFVNCTAVTEINYNAKNVTGMLNSYYNFKGTGSTTNGCVLNIGSEVEVIPDYMFRDSNISKVVIPSQITKIGQESFENCTYLTEIIYNAQNAISEGTSYSSPFNQSGSTSKGLVLSFGDNVVSIPDYLFYRAYVSQINFNKVQTIGNYSFSLCSYLQSIQIPSSVVNIGASAFSSCSGLIEVDIPYGVTFIGSYAFGSCTKLTNFVFPNSLDTISERILYGCTSLKTVSISNTIETIEDSAFSGCTSLTNVTIPSSVKTIESGAFTSCSSFTTITIPETVTSIASSSFSRCSNVTQINYNINVEYGESFDWYSPFNQTGSTTSGCVVTFGQNVISIPAYLFYSSYISQIQIPDSIVRLDSSIFKNCTYLSNVTINSNSSLQYIGEETFYGCSKLTSFNIPRNLMSIDKQAFYGCINLATVTNQSPNITVTAGSTDHGYVAYYATSVTNSTESSLTTINGINYYINGDDYIAHSLADNSLTEIVLENQTTGIRSSAFKYCTNITSLTLPINVENIGESAFKGCTGLQTIICDYANSKLKIISRSAFEGCRLLTSITIPSSVIQIGSLAFNGCSSVEQINLNCNLDQYLTSESLIFEQTGSTVNGCKLYIGSNLVKIPEYLFHKSNISEVEISKNVLSIGSSAFYNCTHLTKVTFQADSLLTLIGGNAFSECSALAEFEMPDNVIAINSYAFKDCTNLTNISLPITIKEIQGSAFAYCSSLTTITIPESVKILESNAFAYCSSLTEINYNANITNSITESSQVFRNTGSLTNGCVLNIGDNITTIKAYLYNYSYISKVVISNQVQEIDSYAFYNCTALENIETPLSLTTIGNHAFYNCTSLLSITVPENVTSVGKYAFYNCSGLTEIYLYGKFDQYTGTLNRYIFGNVGSEVNGCILTIGKNCNGFTDDFVGSKISEIITLDGADISLSYQCFKDNTYLKKVTLTSSVTYLGNSIFENCTSLEEMYYDSAYWYNATSTPNFFKNAGSVTKGFVITIGNTPTKVSRYLFTNSNVTKVIIPQNIQTIESSAFSNCAKLLTVVNNSPYFKVIAGDSDNGNVGKNATNITNEAENHLTDINGINYYTLSDGSYLAYGLKNTGLTEIVFDTKTTAIRSRAFEFCTQLVAITIPESISFIGGRAFQECTGLQQIIYNSNEAKSLNQLSLSWNPFYHAGSTDRGCVVNFGINLTSIQSSLFQYSYVSNIEIPSSITQLDSSTFSNCTYLVSIIIPETITKINSSCFYNCTRLKDIYYRDVIETFKAITIASSNDPFKAAKVHYCYGWDIVSQILPTCTESGLIIYQKDGRTQEVIVEPKGHKLVNNVCTVCGQEIRISATVTETAAGSSYGFIGVNGTYTSNNKNVNSSSAIAEISTQTGCTLTINWTVSSESNYDKLYIYLNGSVQSSVNGVSGSQNGTLTLNLAAGDVVQIKYQKDGSQHTNNDCATFTFTYQ